MTNSTATAATATATATMTATAATAAKANLDKGEETAGQFFPYIPATPPKDLAGYRTVATCYRAKAGKEAKQNVYVRTPDCITTSAVINHIEELAPYVVGLLQKHQDTMIRAIHSRGQLNVFPSAVDLTAIMADLDSNGVGSMSGDDVVAWFTEECLAQVTEQLLNKLGVDADTVTAEQSAKILQVVTSYQDAFVSCCSGKILLPEVQRTKLYRVLELTCTADTPVGAKLKLRLDKMAEREREAVDALGGDLDL